eukprot:377694-Rhodomonas_salina.5
MTTGGGWQDQCGGIYPGIKACQSPQVLFPTCLRARYTLPGTGKAYDATARRRVKHATTRAYRCTRPRTCYAMSGTDLAYDPRACYMMFSTDLAYTTTRACRCT